MTHYELMHTIGCAGTEWLKSAGIYFHQISAIRSTSTGFIVDTINGISYTITFNCEKNDQPENNDQRIQEKPAYRTSFYASLSDSGNGSPGPNSSSDH